MNDISSQEYWTEIEAIAISVTKEAREQDRDISDVLHEALDGHQWVIYTYYNFDVCKHSPNDDAWREAFGSEAPTNLDAVRAYSAMDADVRGHSAFDAEDDDDNDEEAAKDARADVENLLSDEVHAQMLDNAASAYRGKAHQNAFIRGFYAYFAGWSCPWDESTMQSRGYRNAWLSGQDAARDVQLSGVEQ